MGYIDLECDSYSARVILGRHSKTTSSEHIQPSSSGILLEGVSCYHIEMIECIADRDNPHRQYSQIVKHAEYSKVSLMAAEPVWKPSAYWYLDKFSRSNSPVRAGFHSIYRFAVTQLIEHTGKILVSDPRVALINKISDLEVAVSRPMKLVKGFRNLLMAQRVTAVADFLQSIGIEKPQLDLVVGAEHVGIIDCLKMKPEERISRILNDKFCKESIYPFNLPQIHGFKYDSSFDGWRHFKIMDTKLEIS